jgi:uncharacterized protein with von Willebrand factor type A (vWA) domain
MNQKDINAAVDYLYTHGAKYAEAKSHRVYIEKYEKPMVASLVTTYMAEGKAKSVAQAEMLAHADPSYVEWLKGLQAAVEREEAERWGLVSAQARIDVWRSLEASNRSFDRAVS